MTRQSAAAPRTLRSQHPRPVDLARSRSPGGAARSSTGPCSPSSSCSSRCAFLFPLYWMVTGALKSARGGRADPAHPRPRAAGSLTGYTDAWDLMRLPTHLCNTVFYAAGAWVFQLVFCTAAAYALSKLRPAFGKVILGGMLATLMVPALALVVPQYLTVADLPLIHVNLLNTRSAIWLPAVANAFNIFLLKRFFDSIPQRPPGGRRDRRRGHAAHALVDRAADVPAGPRRGLDLRGRRRLEGLPLAAAGLLRPREAAHQRRPRPALPERPAERADRRAWSSRASRWSLIFLVFQRHIIAGLTAGSLKG